MTSMTIVQAAWLGGFFEGEGSITSNNGNSPDGGQPRLDIQQKSLAPLEIVQEVAGGRIRATKNGTWHWEQRDQKGIRRTLTAILPYLVEKKAQAKVALEWQEIQGGTGRRTPQNAEARDKKRELMCKLSALKKLRPWGESP